MTERIKDRRTILICVVSAVTLITYWPVLQSGFINPDDPRYVTINPHVASGLTWQNVEWAFRTSYASNWHPLTWLSHQLDVQLFGLEPGWHHLTNLLFHIANSALLFLLLHTMTAARWRNAFVAALFALHPLHVESVAWVAERKDVLSTFFFMLTILAYIQYAKGGTRMEERSGEKTVASGQKSGTGALRHLPSSLFYLLALICFALGLMSKPMLVTLPFVLLLLDYWPLRRFTFSILNSQRSCILRLILEKLPFFALSAASSCMTLLAQAKGQAVSVGVPLEPRLTNAIVSYLKYLGKAIWPANLAIFYPHPQLGSPNLAPWSWQVISAALVLAALTGCALLRVKREPWFAVGWFWYLGTLVPVIGFVQVGSQAMADRYTYIPLIGLFVVVAWAASSLTGRGHLVNTTASEAHEDSRRPRLNFRVPLVRAVGIAVVLACVLATHNQVHYWHDDLTIFEHALAATKNNPRAHCGLGDEYVRQGKYDLAIQHFRAALAEAPTFFEAYLALGAVLDAEGKAEEALDQFQAAVRVKPFSALAHNFLGVVFLHRGKTEQARDEFAETVRLDPDFADGHRNLARALAGTGHLEEAIDQFHAALACDPGSDLAHFGLGGALCSQGKRGEAIREYQTALRLNPSNTGALNDLAWIRASAPDARLRNGTEAVRLAEQACKLNEFREPQLIGTLAAAYAEAGQFEEAIKTGEQARKLAAANGKTALADRNQELIELYRARRPYHESR